MEKAYANESEIHQLRIRSTLSFHNPHNKLRYPLYEIVALRPEILETVGQPLHAKLIERVVVAPACDASIRLLYGTQCR